MSWRVSFRMYIRGTAPESVPVSDLAPLLESLDQSVRALMPQKARRNLCLSLVDLDRSSVVLGFDVNLQRETEQAIEFLAEAVRTHTFTELPFRAVRFVDRATDFARKHRVAVGLAKSEEAEPRAWIDPEAILRLPSPVVRGETVLYGTVIRVGGRDPRIGLVLDSGEFLSCPAARDVVIAAARRLYGPIGLRGIAEWDAYKWTVTSFEALEVLDYEPVPAALGSELVRRVAGETAWAGANDVVAAVSALRRGAVQDDSVP